MKYFNYLPEHKYPWLPILYSMVLQLKPKTIIEYGTEHGKTAIVMALALKELYETTGHLGKVYTYDTFEIQSKGEIGSCPSYQTATHYINSYPVDIKNFIEVSQGDFFKFNRNENKSFDLLYFDIDNDGSKLLEMYEGCKHLIKDGAVVMFEGGSNTRDNVGWMKDLNKITMNSVMDKVPYKLLTPDQKYCCSIIYNTEIYNIEL